jgi:hypothetical protein
MSDFTTILLTLAIFGLMIICLLLVMTRGHQRMDEIISGVANGVPITTKYRWLMLFYDFWGYVAVGAVLLTVFATGFYRAGELAANPSVGAVANFCAIVCAVGVAGFFVLCLALTHYMGSVLRETKRV